MKQKNENDEEIREIALNKDDMRVLFNVLNNFYWFCRGHKDNLTPIDFVKAKEPEKNYRRVSTLFSLSKTRRKRTRDVSSRTARHYR